MNLQDLVGFLSKIADYNGATAANAYLRDNLSEDQIRSVEWLAGMRCAFQYSELNERRRLLSAAKLLADFDVSLPIEVMFEFGFPRTEFIVNIDLTEGRLGDTLVQLAKYIHAMNALNLVLFVKHQMSSYRRVLLSKSCGFTKDLTSINLSPAVREYLYSVAKGEAFNRKLLHTASPLVLQNIEPLENLNIDISHDVLVLHVRAGDALFLGAKNLPPLNYYTQAISDSGTKKVVIVSEPGNAQDPCVNPVPELIQSFCSSSGIDCIIQSSNKIELDAAILFYAKRVIASTSAFSMMLPLYGKSCEFLMIPGSGSGGWIQDESITHNECWVGLDGEKWLESLDYRLAWVSGEIQPK